MEEKEAIKSKTKGLEGCNFHILPWNQTQLGSTLGGSEMGDPWCGASYDRGTSV